MRLIFGSLISLLMAFMYYHGVHSRELRCPCTHKALHHPIGGLFWVGRDPPNPPECDKPQHYLLPPRGKPVCLAPDHHLSKWLDGKKDNSWHRVFVKVKDSNGPHVEENAVTNKRPRWK
ncbi:chemokine vCXCL1 [Human betaherpesvirus 5]|uniref:VCXCL1 n=1 Tax=Human cytomegalovirus TaxID=10359 RepID=Q5DL67_HCMV|nr:UL146 [Human betaherpesvirus 5]AFR56277.1 chemokine vCXCL1 [Human betaherpesvirus 5]QOX59134.1 vCXCL1 [Human betaherpesvirus 5]QOX59135.1 vCXCL1 [Human betaherpesvirus 5]